MPPEASAQSAVQRELFLRSMAIGRPLSSAARQLGRAMRERFFEAGSVIYEEGSPADDVFFVVRGSVQLSKPGLPSWEFGPNSVVGGIDADLDRARSRTATALTDVDSLVLANDDRLEVLEDNFDNTRTLILFIAARMHELTLQLPGADFSPAQAAAAPLEPGLAPLPLVERVLTLRDTPAFKRASIQALVSLAPVAEEVRLSAGETLFRPGEVSGSLFVVARGLVELERSAPPGSGRYGAPSLLGASAAFGKSEPLYEARALEPSVLLRLGDEEFFDVMEDHFDLARSVLAYMSAERERIQNELELAKRRVS